MAEPTTVTMVDPTGVARDVPVDQVEAAQVQGFRIEGGDERAARVATDAKEDVYSTPLAKVGAFAAGVNRAVSFGASDAIGAAIDPEQARHYRNLREVNPGISTAGELAGTLATAIPTGGESLLAQGLARTPGAAVSRLGARIGDAGEGASALTQIGRSAAGAATEGAAYGIGTGITELALSDKPVDIERVASVLSSHALFGGGVGAAAGSVGKVLELGLGRARTSLASRESHAVVDDLAQMDVKQLRAARDVEVDAIKATHKAETEALEATRVTERQSIADEIAALRQEIKDSNQWATTKDVKLGREGALPSRKSVARKDVETTIDAKLLDDAGYFEPPGGGVDQVKLDKARRAIAEGQREPVSIAISKDGGYYVTDGRHRLMAAIEADAPVMVKWQKGAKGLNAADEAAWVSRGRAGGVASPGVTVKELGLMGRKAEEQLARIVDNPTGLAQNPAKALDALQRQEHVLTKIIERSDDLQAAYARSPLGGRRAAALEHAPKLLEKNRALQARIAKTGEAASAMAMASPRLSAIDAAKESLQVGAASKGGLASIPQRAVEGTAFGVVTGAVSALPIPGAALVGAWAGGAVAKFIGEKVFGKLGAASSAQAARASKAAQAFLGKTAGAVKAGTPVASKVLASLRFGEKGAESTTRKGAGIGQHFDARANEIRKLVEHGPDGKTMMREDARAKVAQHLGPIGTQFPLLADALEELAARRVTFLADRLPKRPDAFASALGPDTWRPSDMEMRKWARYAAGVEDPSSIMDRVVTGGVSPEDAEVMREVYPEMLADLQNQILEQAGSAKSIPYQRRLALSRLTGIPVDPTMDPRILNVIQTAHQAEAGTQGGTESPRASPQFGSVSKALGEPTPAQRRAG